MKPNDYTFEIVAYSLLALALIGFISVIKLIGGLFF